MQPNNEVTLAIAPVDESDRARPFQPITAQTIVLQRVSFVAFDLICIIFILWVYRYYVKLFYSMDEVEFSFH